ncbi:glycosyltransferase 87 family protein [Amnibacterium sp. CER49]|uniref:glycosyltransferase 87 family protein n=1 Tax=Amnibacterium sp. CER49 TaxID=3039161 RepID=UPI0024493F3E|nr:glycosyltransferase 87 family protein [Amnibacterium sp. CER49]MDH2442619.1 glycosyltransferase 87 family protein [Amnibacterium sp. CER49]
MTAVARSALRGRVGARVALAVSFVAVHLLLWWGNTVRIQNTSSSDTHVYLAWMEEWIRTGRLVGVDLPWVYPIGALPPMQLALVLGPASYLAVWVAMVTLLDAVAMVLLARRSLPAAWWWLACIALLGPVGLSHLDGVSVPFAVVGVLAIRRRPAVAAALFTLAAWIKVWPAAMVAALVVAGRRRLAVLLAAAGTCAAVVAAALVAGARGTLFSFIGAQATRGLQIEAPVSSPWLLWGAFGGDARIFYDRRIMTFEVQGRGVGTAAAVMTPVLAVGVAAVVALALVALRRGRDREEVLAFTALGLVSALIALNKVGSPQYYDWLVAPVLLGLLSTRAFRLPAVLVLVVSALTFLIYPVGYTAILGLQPAIVGVLALRDLAVVVLFAWSLWRLAVLQRRPGWGTRPARPPGAGLSPGS